jgi:hypothetical protein
MRHLLTLFLLSLSLAATAQTFAPVEATVNLTRPSVYPEDLAQPGAVNHYGTISGQRRRFTGVFAAVAAGPDGAGADE